MSTFASPPQTPKASSTKAQAAPQQRDASAHQPALEPFVARVAEYAALRERVEQELPPFTETKDPVKLTARQRALAAAIIAARGSVPEGAVFVQESRPALQAIVRRDFATRSRVDKRALGEDVPRRTHVKANAEYPDGLPLVTVPAGLLKSLPPLPDDLEYRIVGADLILLDTRAGLVVDVLRGAVPR